MNRRGTPIRVKLLFAVLAIVMLVVALITASMANLFHEDKTTYIRDLTSIMAVQMSRETNVMVQSYTENLSIFANTLFDTELGASQKQNLIQSLFGSFSEFVAVSVIRENADPVMVYDAATLQQASIATQVMLNLQAENPPPYDQLAAGEVYVRNVTFNNALPMMSIAIAYDVSGQSTDTSEATPPRTAIVGFVRLDRLMELAGRSDAFETWITDSDGHFVAHSDKARVLRNLKREAVGDPVELGTYEHALSTTLDFERDGEQYIGGFAHARFGGMNAGIEIPRSAAYLTARNLLGSLVVIALVLFGAATLVTLFMAQALTRPLESLTQAAQDIGKGDFDVNVNAGTRDELGLLAESFNQMTGELKDRDHELERANNALVQSEKMAAFGQLGAGIAHEVKNPLAGILGYAQLALRKVDEASPLRKHLEVIEKETRRCTEIISNLLKFARQEKAEQKRIDINSVVEDSLDIVDHQLKINQVSIQKNLTPDLPRVYANANQLQQVLMNFAVNAQQAMAGTPGSFSIATRLLDDKRIEMRVADTGPGMPAEIRDKIFEPFFTTKPAGQGTGLGLSVSYGIIRDHGGDIVVESEPGKGTTFVITLPVAMATLAEPAEQKAVV
ncbi:MAG: HAMP domain-containing protein [Gammaproteobacteria bacterium]|nr:HAMP domain-containing protein [Gammaproteobacteria bacterium]NNF60652.1 HAMP domain-containing protein [Gammaproteobacteria bacterium]